MSIERRENRYSDTETARRSDATLKRLLATPPHHTRAAKPDASPKKRGRPPKGTKGNVNGSSTKSGDVGGHEPRRT